jgi:small subunit ribosomal protein S8
MSRNDLVADTLTIIRNALMVKKKNVDVPYSKMVESILGILKGKKYINDFKLMEYTTQKKSPNKLKSFKVYLRYISGEPAITNMKRISKPGLRIYVNKNKIPRVLRGFGTMIVSTSSGVLTDEEARLKKIGGEVICSVW